MSGLASALLSSDWLEDEGDEWEPATAAVCRRLEEQRGIRVPGEMVRRAIREAGVETRMRDGRLEVRAGDVIGLVDAVEGKAKRSAARQRSGAVI
jgi:hypothetical protein